MKRSRNSVTHWDAIVVGGGPAGAATGALLAKQSRRVLLLEREEFPRFRVGESLLPQSCPVFEELGLMDALDARFIRKYGAVFIDSHDGNERGYRFADAFDDRYPYAYEVDRKEFDELLLNRAIELGVTLRQPCHVQRILFDGTRAVGVAARDAEGHVTEHHASVIVDASGRGSMIAAKLRGKRRLTGLDTTGIFAHYRGVTRRNGDAAGDIEIVIVDGGWLWFIPFKGVVTSVGAVLTREKMNTRGSQSMADFFDAVLGASPYAATKLAHAERVNDVSTAADFSYHVERSCGDGWLCVGDAGGFIDPVFSSGVHLALRGASVAAKVIGQGLDHDDVTYAALREFETTMQRATAMFVGAVQAFYEGSFRDLLFAKDQRKLLRQIVTSMLAGDVLHPAVEAPIWTRFVRKRYEPNWQTTPSGEPTSSS